MKMSYVLQTEFDTLPGCVDRNDTVADSLMTLWTTSTKKYRTSVSYQLHNIRRDSHSAIGDFNPLRL